MHLYMCIGSLIHAHIQVNSSMSGDDKVPFLFCIDIGAFCQRYNWPRLYSRNQFLQKSWDKMLFAMANFTNNSH